MKLLRLPKERLDLFASVLQQFGEVHAPVARNDGFVFQRLNRWSEATLEYPRTVLPPKKYFLPPKETLLLYDAEGNYTVPEDGLVPIVLFGVHACDIYALNILDRVFGPPHPDPYFQARRRSVALIGIDCSPDEHCFCRSMRADFVESGFDLFFHDLGESFLVFVGSPRGDDMTLATDQLFETVRAEDIDEYKRRSEAKRQRFALDVEIRDLPEIFELEYQNELWDDLGSRCLACGSCSLVCPTCYCFDVTDTNCLSGGGERCRSWDSCLFRSHAEVAGGENFRGDPGARIRFRFYHKQRGFVAEYGRPSCVGCGRCRVACPVGIDIVEVVHTLRGVREHGDVH